MEELIDNFMSRPKFSIITIAYNSGKTIERTIKSVLEQSFPDYEYIVVDGLSSDNTLEIVKKYEPLFEGKMKWISEKDKGIYNAMNKGIKMSSGNVIGIVNSDDWLDKNALSNVYTSVQLNMHDDDSLYCGNLIFHYNNGGEHIREASKNRLDTYAKSYDIGIFHPATFVGRKVYETVGLFDEQFSLNADTDFILRCYKEKKNFVFIPYVLSNMSDGGATNSGHTAKEMQDRKLVLKKHCKNPFEFWYLWSVYFIKIYAKRILPHSLVVKIRSNKDK